MTTIIIRKNKDGAITGRCDARCYNAKGKKCNCVCGGVNHGKGINEAILFTSQYFDVLQDLDKETYIYLKQGQLQLFEEVNL